MAAIGDFGGGLCRNPDALIFELEAEYEKAKTGTIIFLAEMNDLWTALRRSPQPLDFAERADRSSGRCQRGLYEAGRLNHTGAA